MLCGCFPADPAPQNPILCTHVCALCSESQRYQYPIPPKSGSIPQSLIRISKPEKDPTLSPTRSLVSLHSTRVPLHSPEGFLKRNRTMEYTLDVDDVARSPLMPHPHPCSFHNLDREPGVKILRSITNEPRLPCIAWAHSGLYRTRQSVSLYRTIIFDRYPIFLKSAMGLLPLFPGFNSL